MQQSHPGREADFARLQVGSSSTNADNCNRKGPFAGLNGLRDSTKPRRSTSGRGFVNTGGVLSWTPLSGGGGNRTRVP